jgi:cytochrome c peroxidase
MKWIQLLILSLFILFLALLWRQHQQVFLDSASTSSDGVTPNVTTEPIMPLSDAPELEGGKVALGEKLFNDPQLSHDDSISCASCHALSKGGTDQKARSSGIGGKVGPINAPTVFNASLNFKQFWDGRANTLEAQVAGPIHNPDEMGSNWVEVVGKLEKSSSYVKEFSDIYPDSIQINNIKDAIATFERSLLTPNSRFDQYLSGVSNALTDEEKEGYRLFKTYGCVSCHQGVNIGGNLFQKFGVIGDYFTDRGFETKADWGRFNVTGDEADRYVFKVPSLRNVALTPPYFHDGSAKQLEDAVTTMSRYQLGHLLMTTERDAIVKFLKTLSGEYKGKVL